MAETKQLKQFLSDVRTRKASDPDNWQSSFNISTEAPVFGSTAVNGSLAFNMSLEEREALEEIYLEGTTVSVAAKATLSASGSEQSGSESEEDKEEEAEEEGEEQGA